MGKPREIDLETLSRYVNLNQIRVSEININRAKAFGDLLGRAVKSLFMAQPESEENYFSRDSKIGTPYLYRGPLCMRKEIPDHDAVIKYNVCGKGREEIPLALLDVEKNLWHKVMPQLEESPEVLQRDVTAVMVCLGLAENQ